MCLLVIAIQLLFLCSTGNSIDFDFELSKAQNIWQGRNIAVHYKDHLKLLNQQKDNQEGEIYTNVSFVFREEWSLSFRLDLTGNMIAQKDGFIIYLTGEDPGLDTSQKHNSSHLTFTQMKVS